MLQAGGQTAISNKLTSTDYHWDVQPDGTTTTTGSESTQNWGYFNFPVCTYPIYGDGQEQLSGNSTTTSSIGVTTGPDGIKYTAVLGAIGTLTGSQTNNSVEEGNCFTQRTTTTTPASSPRGGLKFSGAIRIVAAGLNGITITGQQDCGSGTTAENNLSVLTVTTTSCTISWKLYLPYLPLYVNAGPDQTVYIANGPIQPNIANLQGTVSGGSPPVVSGWQTTSRPGNSVAPTIASPNSPTTTAQYYTPGKYTETLGAADSAGNSAASSMTVTVCPDVDLITAQGIRQGGPGLYPPLDKFVSSFTQAYLARTGLARTASENGAVEVQNIPWTSLSLVGLVADLVGAEYQGNLTVTMGRLTTTEQSVPSYQSNVKMGIDALTGTVSGEQNMCPKTKIVLLGYSEGSDVVLQFLQGSFANIAAVYLYGTPRFNPSFKRNSPGSAFNNFQSGLAEIDRHQGLMGEMASFPDQVTLSTCHPGDMVCQGLDVPKACLANFFQLPQPLQAVCAGIVGQRTGAGIAPHFTYGPDAQIDGLAAGAQLGSASP